MPYIFARKHKAELNGETVTFSSYHRPGSSGLHGDAIQACKNAGIYRKFSDADRIKVDGVSLGRRG